MQKNEAEKGPDYKGNETQEQEGGKVVEETGKMNPPAFVIGLLSINELEFEHTYKISGIYSENNNAMVFNMSGLFLGFSDNFLIVCICFTIWSSAPFIRIPINWYNTESIS